MTKPIVKWVGGKSRYVNRLEELMPSYTYPAYYEPFAGSLALWCHLNVQVPSFLSDINADLILTYLTVRSHYREVAAELNSLGEAYADRGSDFYYETRDRFNAARNKRLFSEELIAFAAMFIFLNRTGFNGLYRVNKTGTYNVPEGRYGKVSLLQERVIEFGQHCSLKSVHFDVGDYRNLIPLRYSFVYVDPPYDKVKTSSFQGYSPDEFDQERLAIWLDKLSDNGIMWMMTNARTEWVLHRYKGYDFQEIDTVHSVNRDGHGRVPNRELVVRNYV